MRNKVTIREVAERAGVSTATVSRTLNDHPRISDSTKKRVMSAVEELNYRPGAVQSSTPQAAKILGLILPNSTDDLFLHPFFGQVMRGISIYAQTRGYFITYAFSKEIDQEVDFIRRYVDSGMVQGLILLSIRKNDRCVEYLCDRKFPFSVIGRPETPRELLWVDNDNFHAMYNVVNHLVERGCRDIAFIGGPMELNVTRDRLEGYRMALINRGLEVRPDRIISQQDVTEAAGQRAMVALLQGGGPDGVVATDDFLALGAMRARDELELAPIPCVGFNNTVRGKERNPSLSSVEINPDQLGFHATRLLINRVETGDPTGDHTIVPTRYEPRQSTFEGAKAPGR